MTTKNKLASAALVGLLAAGAMIAQPAFAGTDKASCKTASGCKGKAQAEKTTCKGQDKASCTGKDTEKASCKAASSCKGKDGK